MAPEITFSTDKTRIGRSEYATIAFSCDIATSAFEARATRSGDAFGLGIGLLVGAFASTPAGVQRTFEIYDTELTSGDGVYDIYLYAQSAQDGSWNDNEAFWTSQSEPLITAGSKDFLSGR